MVEHPTTANDAVFLYMGIFDAYEAISEELVGENVLEEEVLPRMIYYVRNFLPEKIMSSDDQSIEELHDFIRSLRERVYAIQSGDEQNTITMDEIWELRAAIFGFESVFLEILGDQVIEEYVNPRVGEILGSYLPSIFSNNELSVEQKLDEFSKYLKKNKFVKEANFSLRGNEVEYRVNRCAFANIHNSDAYLDANTRYCPWGMISSAIVSSGDSQNKMKSCTFTTRGSITELEVLE